MLAETARVHRGGKVTRSVRDKQTFTGHSPQPPTDGGSTWDRVVRYSIAPLGYTPMPTALALFPLLAGLTY